MRELHDYENKKKEKKIAVNLSAAQLGKTKLASRKEMHPGVKEEKKELRNRKKKKKGWPDASQTLHRFASLPMEGSYDENESF